MLHSMQVSHGAIVDGRTRCIVTTHPRVLEQLHGLERLPSSRRRGRSLRTVVLKRQVLILHQRQEMGLPKK